MSYRTVIVKNRGKLSYSLNYLIFRGEKELKIHLSEITSLIIQSTATVITTSLLSELARRNIKVVFCDYKCNPQAELMPYFGTHNSSKRIQEQALWNEEVKDLVWKKIVELKVISQSRVLDKYGFSNEKNMLLEYAQNVRIGDTSNREGHAAKVYFNTLFGKDFSRAKQIPENTYLNYGYTILLSAFNREITNHGYLTQLGLHHCNEYNGFNLSCDLIEPFRPIIDDYVKSGKLNEVNFKKELTNIFNIKIKLDGKESYLDNALKIYVQNIFRAIEERDTSKISLFDSYEL